MKKLWTGKTPRQALFANLCVTASVKGLTVNEALETVLDGAEQCLEGSEKRASLDYWSVLSGDAQQRFLGEARSALRAEDRLVGRKVTR